MSRTVTFEVEVAGEPTDEDMAFMAGVGTAHLEMSLRLVQDFRLAVVTANY